MRCHTIIDQGKRVFIPGCMGGAVYGRSGCTCAVNTQIKTDYERIVALEERVARLEKMLAKYLPRDAAKEA